RRRPEEVALHRNHAREILALVLVPVERLAQPFEVSLRGQPQLATGTGLRALGRREFSVQGPAPELAEDLDPLAAVADGTGHHRAARRRARVARAQIFDLSTRTTVRPRGPAGSGLFAELVKPGGQVRDRRGSGLVGHDLSFRIWQRLAHEPSG